MGLLTRAQSCLAELVHHHFLTMMAFLRVALSLVAICSAAASILATLPKRYTSPVVTLDQGEFMRKTANSINQFLGSIPFAQPPSVIDYTTGTSPVVTLDQGEFLGKTVDGINQFLGIPFAQPPSVVDSGSYLCPP